jgi:Tfp pilus assembly protein PilO
MTGARSPWRQRVRAFAVLGAVVLLDAGALVAYSGFYDTNIKALEETQKDLETKRDAARASLDQLSETEKRLDQLSVSLDDFYAKALGTRRERLAPLIEEIHTITQKAGLRPESISYAAKEVPGADSIRLAFRVSGRYADIRRLLAAFESNARFLVVDTVGIGGLSEVDGETLDVSLQVAHFFRDAGARSPRRRVEAADAERAAAPASAPVATAAPAAARKAPPRAAPPPSVKVREAPGGER